MILSMRDVTFQVGLVIEPDFLIWLFPSLIEGGNAPHYCFLFHQGLVWDIASQRNLSTTSSVVFSTIRLEFSQETCCSRRPKIVSFIFLHSLRNVKVVEPQLMDLCSFVRSFAIFHLCSGCLRGRY